MKKVLRAALSGVYLSALTFLVFMIIKGFRGGQEITYSAIDMAYSCIAVIIIPYNARTYCRKHVA